MPTLNGRKVSKHYPGRKNLIHYVTDFTYPSTACWLNTSRFVKFSREKDKVTCEDCKTSKRFNQ